jgi:hypothetical protein
MIEPGQVVVEGSIGFVAVNDNKAQTTANDRPEQPVQSYRCLYHVYTRECGGGEGGWRMGLSGGPGWRADDPS